MNPLVQATRVAALASAQQLSATQAAYAGVGAMAYSFRAQAELCSIFNTHGASR
jgi:hypothetical protein